MRFIDFIKKLPDQQDPGVNSFLAWAKVQMDFPASSDPNELAKGLYKKLNHKMTTGFQKCLMIYSSMPNNEIPAGLLKDQPNMLRALNKIVELQHADKSYKDF